MSLQSKRTLKIKPLPWDSDFLGKSVGVLVLHDHSSVKFIEAVASYDLLYVFADKPVTFSPSFEAAFVCNAVDEKLTYRKKIQGLEGSPSATIEKLPIHFKPDNAFYQLAVQSGLYSRFAKDPLFPASLFHKMYHLWLERSLTGEMADMVFVYKSDGMIAGFVTLKKNTDCGDIGLLAVNEQSRSLGIATGLIQRAEEQAYSHFKLSRMEIVTQATNTTACRFYEKCGYSVIRRQYIYHCWKK